MISRWRMTALLSLCLVGTIACGFSTWIWNESRSGSTGDIEVGVGDVKSNVNNVVYFQSAKVSDINKKGFRHDDTAIVKEENKDVTYDISYYSNDFEIQSIWKIKPSTLTSFEYSIIQNSNGAQFSFLDNVTAENITFASYDSYDEKSDKVIGNVVSGTSVSGVACQNGKLTMNLTIPALSMVQYLCLTYHNSAKIPDKSDFETAVYDNVVSVHGMSLISFDVSLNKVGM